MTVAVEVVCASLSLELEDDLPPLLSELPPRPVNPNNDGLPPLPLEVYSATFRRPLGMMGLEATKKFDRVDRGVKEGQNMAQNGPRFYIFLASEPSRSP